MSDAHTAELVRGPRYWIRRFGWWLRNPEEACLSYLCPKPRLGLSRWCRHHTDAILERRTNAH